MTRLNRDSQTTYELHGVLGDYLAACSEQWLKVAPLANPGMLEIFRDRDLEPHRDLVPWAGEFAGKYLQSAVQTLRLTGDPELKDLLKAFVAELVDLQDDEGYLGPWPTAKGLTNDDGTWDTWGHYHIMLGLLFWHEDTGDSQALACAKDIGDRLCRQYAPGASPPLAATGGTDKNLSPAHSLCLLYRQTQEKRYLELATRIAEEEFSRRDENGNCLAGDFLEGPLSGLMFFELPFPRWESLHAVMALAELYDLTGDERYRKAFVRNWESMAKTDRHNNGGFTADERAQGDPFHPGAIETCCTIAWTALSVEMLRLTGDSRAADELEFSTLNSITGAHSPSGHWSTYDTPMDGVKRASAHTIVFQSREGTPELNCCSVNSIRGFGLVSDWAVMRRADGAVALNWYGPGRVEIPLEDGVGLGLDQETDYPYAGTVKLTVNPTKTAAFPLELRIPRWSRQTTVTVNGEHIPDVTRGSYLTVERTWKRGDIVEIHFDMSVYILRGARSCDGKVSFYRGPLLLAWDHRYNDHGIQSIPPLDGTALSPRMVKWEHWLPPRLLLECTAVDGTGVRLCDFDSAGRGGSRYCSWLSAELGDQEVFEPLALTEADMLRAALGILIRGAEEFAAGLPKDYYAPHLAAQLANLRDHAAELTDVRARARTIVNTDPASPAAKELAGALERLDKNAAIDDQLVSRINQALTALCKEHDLPQP